MRPELSGKSVFVFDWDGTLFDSMAAKTKSFSAVVHAWLVEQGATMPLAEAARLYREYSGRPRAEVMKIIASTAGKTATNTDCQVMSDALFAANRIALEATPLFDDALPALRALIAGGHTLCISSSVPQNELSHFVSIALPGDVRDRLVAVLGSQPLLSKGLGHLRHIARQANVTAPSMIVIGDDEADWTLSREAAVDCLLVDRDGHIPKDAPRIPSLNYLHEMA